MAFKIGLARIVGGKTKLPTSHDCSPGAKRTLKKCNRKFIRRYTEVVLQEEFLEMQQEAEEEADNYAFEYEAFLWECREAEDLWVSEYLDHLDRKGPEEIAALQ